MSRTYLILDVSYLAYRARFAMGNSLSYGGTPTTIIYSFLRELIGLQDQFRTSRLLFCFDSKSSKRKKLYPQYKEKRHSKELTEEELEFEKAFRYQIKMLREKYLPEIGYRNIYRETGFESDDLIAQLSLSITIKNALTKNNTRAIIISADHDLFQCITQSVSFYNPSDRKELTLQAFKQKYGIVPLRWSQVKAIVGCSTDGVEGIHGVGEITAVKYLLGKLGEKTKAFSVIDCEEGRAVIERNLPLVKLPFANTPVPKIRKDKLSVDGWKSVCRQLGLKSLKNENPFPWSRLK